MSDPHANFSAHVASCLLVTDNPGGSSAAANDQEALEDDNEDDDVDIDGQEFEEYTWAGQTRVRATALIEGTIYPNNTYTLNNLIVMGSDFVPRYLQK